MRYQLYIKESPLGLKYLGKFKADQKMNVYQYLGSGKHWKAHLKKHGFKAQDIKTCVIAECEALENFKIVGQYYSDLFCVVDSPEWANLRPETGDGGSNKGKKRSIESKRKMSEAHKGRKLSDDIRKKISKANKGRKFSKETKKKMSESKKGRTSNNAKSIIIDSRPFSSINTAAKYFKIPRSTFRKKYITFK